MFPFDAVIFSPRIGGTHRMSFARRVNQSSSTSKNSHSADTPKFETETDNANEFDAANENGSFAWHSLDKDVLAFLIDQHNDIYDIGHDLTYALDAYYRAKNVTLGIFS